MNIAIPPGLQRVLDAARAAGGRPYLVGGAVRDALLALPLEDFDVEVYGLSATELRRALEAVAPVDAVGQAFAVFKLGRLDGVNGAVDVSLPRRDSKAGPGHRGIAVVGDPFLPLEEASRRRDFTMNAMLFDPATGELIDLHGGRRDLETRCLRAVDPASFGEDPLRALRAVQLAARFELAVDPDTARLCAAMPLQDLPAERIWGEIQKLLLKARKPSQGLALLKEWGLLATIAPELLPLEATPQDPEWHPEGDVFVHTGHCLDRLVELPEWRAADRESRVVYSLAVLAHDFGKPETTHREVKRGVERIVSPGHEAAGVLRAESFFERIGAPEAVVRRVAPLVREHLVGMQEMTPRAIRRLARRLAPENIEGLAIVMTADAMGRPPLPAVVPPHVVALLEAARREEVAAAAPVPVLLGRHLVELGLPPGPAIGALLEFVYDAQLDGAFVDLAGARAWLLAHAAGRLGDEARQRLADRVAAGA